MATEFTTREQIVEICNKLFYYTDERDWDHLKSEVFTDIVFLDMISLGQKAEEMSSTHICDIWAEGFKELDAVHHQSGNYIVNIGKDGADVIAYAIASHYKKDATEGYTRIFVGSYNFHLVDTEKGWRIDKFKYNVKYMDGNIEMK